MKTFYFDTETTGLNPTKNGIIQIAGIIEEDGQLTNRILLDINPGDVEYNDRALEVNGKTKEIIASYTPTKKSFRLFTDFLDENVDKYDKSDKLTPSGYNVGFDIKFLQRWFQDNHNKFYGSYFNYYDSDTFSLVKLLRQVGKIPDNLPTYNLSGIYEFIFNKELENAHDAMVDIEATILLHKEIINRYLK